MNTNDPTWARWLLYPETCPHAPLRWYLTAMAWSWDTITNNRWSPLHYVFVAAGRVIEWMMPSDS